MKNVVTVMAALSLMGLTGCATELHTNTKGSNVLVHDVETIPMEVGIKVGEKITGHCEYSTFLFFTTKAPTKLAYGVDFENSGANFGGPCTYGAVYDAVTVSNADVLVAPRYFTEGSTFGCVPFIGCISRKANVTVIGYKGTYEEFKKVDPELRKVRAAAGVKPASATTKMFNQLF